MSVCVTIIRKAIGLCVGLSYWAISPVAWGQVNGVADNTPFQIAFNILDFNATHPGSEFRRFKSVEDHRTDRFLHKRSFRSVAGDEITLKGRGTTQLSRLVYVGINTAPASGFCDQFETSMVKEYGLPRRKTPLSLLSSAPSNSAAQNLDDVLTQMSTPIPTLIERKEDYLIWDIDQSAGLSDMNRNLRVIIKASPEGACRVKFDRRKSDFHKIAPRDSLSSRHPIRQNTVARKQRQLQEHKSIHALNTPFEQQG